MLFTSLIRQVPTCCLLCGVSAQHPFANICQPCLAELPMLRTVVCQHCGLPVPSKEVSCGECLRNPPPFSRCLAPLRYDTPIDSLLNQIKHQREFSSLPILIELTVEHLQKNITVRPDLVVAVPSFWINHLRRGFNLAELLASQLAQRMHFPHHISSLSKIHATPNQQGLVRKARLKNLRGAFQSHRQFTGLDIALVDDVVTTGTTVREMSKVLLQNGARSVQIWCIARATGERFKSS